MFCHSLYPGLFMNEVYKNSGPYLKILNFHKKFPDALFIVYTSAASISYISPIATPN